MHSVDDRFCSADIHTISRWLSLAPAG